MTGDDLAILVGGLTQNFVLYVIAGGVAISAKFQWQSYKLLSQHDTRLMALEKELAIVRSQMVTWDTLKRIELYLSQMQPKDASTALVGALRAESEARRQQ